MGDFLKLLMDSTKEDESPKRFYYWSGLAALSAILKDNVWTSRGKRYDLFPNIYVILYAPSGARKGPPINLAHKLVRLVDNTRIINGRASIEAIIKELGTYRSRPNGKEAFKDACAFIPASELSMSLIHNPQSMEIMTDLYDRHYRDAGEWQYLLKVGESTTLKKPTITWLGGTNEALFTEFMPEKNIKGGLVGRTYIIMEKESNGLNSLMFDSDNPPNIGEMVEILRCHSKLKGEFQIPDEMRGELDKFYLKFMKDIAPGLKDDTGFVNRLLDFVIKNAMLIAIGRKGHLILDEDSIREAIEVTTPLILPTKKVGNASKKTDLPSPEKKARVLRYFVNHNFTASRKSILQNLGLYLDHEDLNKIMEMLTQADVAEQSLQGHDIIYRIKTERPEIKSWLEEHS